MLPEIYREAGSASFLAGVVPRLWVGFVAPMAMIAAFRHGVVLDQLSQGPAFQRAIRFARSLRRDLLLGVAFHGQSRIS